jgi:hypothetical protein
MSDQSQSRFYEGSDEQILCAWFQEVLGANLDSCNLHQVRDSFIRVSLAIDFAVCFPLHWNTF